MSDLLGKPLVINYWGTWCVPCIREFPAFDRIKKVWGTKANFIMVSDEGTQLIQSFKDKNPYRFTYLRTLKGFENINVRPTTFFYNKNGELIVQNLAE